MTTSPIKTTIVTGASRGIGRAVALRLARDGFAIVVNYAGNTAKAEEVVSEIKSAGGRAIAVQANVAKATDVERLFDEADRAFGSIGVVVNSAGIMKMLPLATSSGEDFDAIFATNVRGTFNVLQQAARRVPDGSRLITFSTSVLALSLPNYGPYAAGRSLSMPSPPARLRRSCSSRANRKSRLPASPGSRRWSAWALRTTSPVLCRFSPLRTAGGSTDRCCELTADMCEVEQLTRTE